VFRITRGSAILDLNNSLQVSADSGLRNKLSPARLACHRLRHLNSELRWLVEFQRRQRSLMLRPRATTPTVMGLCFLFAGCSLRDRSTRPPIAFDTSYSAHKDWKLLEEGPWGIRLNVPPTLRETRPGHKSLWIHEGTNLRESLLISGTLPQTP
jgi:hypothetical protein